MKSQIITPEEKKEMLAIFRKHYDNFKMKCNIDNATLMLTILPAMQEYAEQQLKLSEISNKSYDMLYKQLKEANEFLNLLQIPTNGLDADGNSGYGKRENLTLKQRLTFLQKKIDHNILKSAIKKYGTDLQIEMIEEECLELLIALRKLKRNKFSGEDITKVIDEIADVTIMMEQAKLIFYEKDINARIDYKMKRLNDKLKTK